MTFSANRSTGDDLSRTPNTLSATVSAALMTATLAVASGNSHFQRSYVLKTVLLGFCPEIHALARSVAVFALAFALWTLARMMISVPGWVHLVGALAVSAPH